MSFRMSRSGFSAHPLAKNPTIRAVIKRQLTNHAEIKGFSFSFLPFPFSPHALTSFSWKTWMILGFLASCRAKVPAPSGPSRSPAPSRIRAAAACCPPHAACRAVGGEKKMSRRNREATKFSLEASREGNDLVRVFQPCSPGLILLRGKIVMLRGVRTRCRAPIYALRGRREASKARIYSEGVEGEMQGCSCSPPRRVVNQTEGWGSYQFWQWPKPCVYTFFFFFFLREMLMQEIPHRLTTGMPARCIAIATVFTFELRYYLLTTHSQAL